MEVNIYYEINTPIVKAVSKYFILIDNYTPANSIKLHLSLDELNSVPLLNYIK